MHAIRHLLSDISRHAPLLAVVLIALNPHPAGAADLVFADGTRWTDVKIVSQEPTSLIVLHGCAVVTVHAAQLRPECMAALKLRLPNAEELAARAAAEKRAGDEAAQRREQLKQLEAEQAAYAARVEAERKERERAGAEMRASQPQTVQVVPEPSAVIPRELWGHAEIWIDGRVLSRLSEGAVVQGDGPPAGEGRGRGWVEGTVFVQEDNRLNATSRGTPVSGRVIPTGEYRYTDSSGVVRVMAAYRLY